ncbi:MAG: Cdc6/Cdc18 family protein [Candidatus Thalassarchaeum sp.]
MADYLDRIGAGKVLLDRTPFSFDWTPPTLVGRDDELRELASMFVGIENQGVSGRAVITGPVGSGKTVMTHRFGEDLQRVLDGRRKLILAHVNCRNHPTASQVLQEVARSLDSGHPERGFSSSEVIQSIRRNLGSHDTHLLLVLDEVDVLIRNDKGDLIYKLLRIDEGQNRQGSLSIILVSQLGTLLKLFEPAIISRLGQTNVLKLSGYDEAVLTSIARQRYEEACRPGSVGDETLAKIGKISSEKGDARLAIELLEDSVLRAEGNGRGEVLVEDVLHGDFHNLKDVNIEDWNLDNLGEHQKLVLLGICRRLKKKNEISSGDAQKLYALVCEEYGVKPRSYTTFWKHLKKLEEEGLIQSRTANATIGRGRTQHITIDNAPPGEIESRLEKDLM